MQHTNVFWDVFHEPQIKFLLTSDYHSKKLSKYVFVVGLTVIFIA